MNIKRLQLTRMCTFDRAEFDFNPGMNLLVSVNGVGKTTVLDVLRICLSKMLPAVTASCNRPIPRDIAEILYGPQGDDPLSPANAQRALQTICARNRQGLFYEFCVAIKDALEAQVRALRRLAQRRRAARR